MTAELFVTGPDALDLRGVVAVFDTGCDLHHPDLINKFWRNNDEICDNGIDDDNNGYVDDCYGYVSSLDYVIDSLKFVRLCGTSSLSVPFEKICVIESRWNLLSVFSCRFDIISDL